MTLRNRQPMKCITSLSRRAPLRAKSAPARTGRARKPPKDTGFSDATRLLIRTRAGNGDPEEAACEACAIWLGLDGGQIQHIYARGQGGSRRWLYNSAANGALLCGTRYTGCHQLCEDRDPHMNEAGFWRRRNAREKPGDYPVMLHGKDGGITVWLAPDGGYSFKPPEDAEPLPDGSAVAVRGGRQAGPEAAA